MRSSWNRSWGTSWGRAWGRIAKGLISYGGGYTEDDYQRHRKHVEELESAQKAAREDQYAREREFNDDISAAFNPPPEPVPEPVKEFVPVVVPKFPAIIQRAIVQAEQEDQEMIMLLLAA